MRILKMIKKGMHIIIKEPLGRLFLVMLLGYLTLFVAFITLLIDRHPISNSEWFTENFSFQEHATVSEASFYTKLLLSQEPLGEEFEKVIHQNLWDLYES